MSTLFYDELYQFLAGYWYERGESDDDIVDEFVNEVDLEFAEMVLDLVRTYVESDRPPSEKAAFIRKAVRKWFPSDDDQAPVAWLGQIADLLDARLPRVI